MRRALALIGCLAACVAQADEWPMRDAQTRLSFNAALLADIGLSVRGEATDDRFPAHSQSYPFAHTLTFTARTDTDTRADLGPPVFERITGEGLEHRGALSLRWRGGRWSLRRFVLAPAFAPRTFELRSSDGEVAFRADYAHFDFDRTTHRLRLFNLDLRIARDLAERMGQPMLADTVIGTLEMTATVDLPDAAAKANPPPSCSDWSGDVDVALIDIGSIDQWGRANGLVAISPSATLKNVGTANVPWYSKFSGPFEPHQNDQHPFLAWGIYRIANGRIEQIGVSDVKHAFFAVNTNCNPGACTGDVNHGGFGHILGLGCEDTYSQSNNQSVGALSFRPEVRAGSGVWNHTGSHFDQNHDGVQDHFGENESFLDHGALVAESALTTGGARYALDAWYVVRGDIDPFNTMGWREFAPNFTGTIWTFSPLTPFVQGSVLDAWVPASAPPAGSHHALMTLPEGHVRLAMTTTDLGGGQIRYEYALLNHDFDRGIDRFFVPTNGTPVTDLYFHDVDGNPSNDWSATQDSNGITFTKPPAADAQGWGTLYNFGFTAASLPRMQDATAHAAESGDPIWLSIPTLAPEAFDLLLRDSFE